MWSTIKYLKAQVNGRQVYKDCDLEDMISAGMKVSEYLSSDQVKAVVKRDNEKLDNMYLFFIPDMVGKVNAFSNWGHHQTLCPNKPFKTSRFVAMTKTNLLNINSVLLHQPIEED